MSGYSQGHTRSDVLDNGIWTTKAQQLGQRIGHPISNSFASHVEKQLLAYYIDKHWLLDQDTDLESADEEKLRALLPRPPRALITVNKPSMCPDCRAFLVKLQQIFDLLYCTYPN